MTEAEFKKLKEGDVISSRTGYGYIVTQRISGTELVAVRTLVISNPSEWELVGKK